MFHGQLVSAPALGLSALPSAFPLVEGGTQSSSTRNMSHRRKNIPVASQRTCAIELEFWVKVEHTGVCSVFSFSLSEMTSDPGGGVS